MLIDCGAGANITCNIDKTAGTLQHEQLVKAFKTFVEKNGTLGAEMILDKLNKQPYLEKA
jgi:hypothetical protein